MKKNTQTYKGRLSFDKHSGKMTIFDSGCSYSGVAASKSENLVALVPSAAQISFASALKDTGRAPADVMPTAQTVFNAPFRLISATIVGGGTYKATDFSDEAILRNSMEKLLNQTVYTDHWNYSVENWLGVVSAVSWTAAYNQDGMNIPAGIDGVLSLNTATERGANIATGILMGAVHSNSVSVEFEWVPSHEFQNSRTEDGIYEFYEMLGMIGADGKMVRRIVTAITAYYETSIVNMGADPYAKKIDAQGNITNIDTAAIVSLSKENFKELEGRYKKYDCRVDETHRTEMASFTSSKFNAPKPEKTEKMQMSKFSDTVNLAIEAVIAGKHYANRTAVLDAMATECGCSLRQIQNYLNGTTTCPPQTNLTAMARVLMLGNTDLIAACESDGCTYTAPTATGAGETVVGPFGKDKAPATVEAEKTEASDDCEEEEEEEEDVTEMTDKKKMTAAEVNAEIEELKAKYAAANKALEKEQTAKAEAVAKYNKVVNDLVQLEALKNGISGERDTLLTEKNTISAQAEFMKNEKAQMQQELETLREGSKFAKLGRENFEALRAEAINFYRKTSANNMQPVILNLIEKTEDVAYLQAICAQFGAELGEKMSYSCKKCGSHEFNFGSVVESRQPATSITQEDIKTDIDVQQAFSGVQVFNPKK